MMISETPAHTGIPHLAMRTPDAAAGNPHNMWTSSDISERWRTSLMEATAYGYGGGDGEQVAPRRGQIVGVRHLPLLRDIATPGRVADRSQVALDIPCGARPASSAASGRAGDLSTSRAADRSAGDAQAGPGEDDRSGIIPGSIVEADVEALPFDTSPGASTLVVTSRGIN